MRAEGRDQQDWTARRRRRCAAAAAAARASSPTNRAVREGADRVILLSARAHDRTIGVRVLHYLYIPHLGVHASYTLFSYSSVAVVVE